MVLGGLLLALANFVACTLLLRSASTDCQKLPNCSSNLRELGQALMCYLEDYERPPIELHALGTYFGSAELPACPDDPLVARGGWYGCHYLQYRLTEQERPEFPVSYAYSPFLNSNAEAWEYVRGLTNAGWLACVVHGEPNPATRSRQFYSGTVLRLRFDGSTQSRDVVQPEGQMDLWKVLTDQRWADYLSASGMRNANPHRASEAGGR